MFPTYALSTTTAISGTHTYTLVSTTSPFHVVAVRMQQSKDLSETVVQCTIGGKLAVIGHNYAKDYPLDLLNFDCDSDVVILKTGNDEAFVSVTYIPDWAIPTTTPRYMQGFSYGEIMISFLLLIVVASSFFGGILNRLTGAKTKPVRKIQLG